MKRPFIAKAAGTDVFVGPQTATAMANLKKALLSQDAVITVAGPAGVGKTTLVARALQALATTHKSVRIGRMHLQGTDALEFLLEELGVENPPKGPIRQFAALRQCLNQLESRNTRLVIVVEDAARVGPESLAELESLTAADAGDSGGAAIVLMGDGNLPELLKDPQLARLRQRVRQRNRIEPLCAAEVRGYLTHCFRLAGVDFEHIFESGSSQLLHDLCGGIPRMVNNITEGVLGAAASKGLEKIPTSFVAEVAKREFDVEAVEFDAGSKAEVAPPAPVAEPEPEVLSEPAPDVVETRQPLQVSDPEPEPAPAVEEPAEDPVIVFTDETGGQDEPTDDADIPELIQDTLPDLEILVPEVMAAEPEAFPEPVLEPEPEPVSEAAAIPELEDVIDGLPEAGPIPELKPEPVAEAPPALEPEPQPEPIVDAAPEPDPESPATTESTSEDVPEWERDPTLAQLKPDLDALEKAMAFAQGDGEDEPEIVPIGLANTDAPPAEPEPEEIPEITLDNAIQSRIENNLIDEPGQISPNAPETPAAANGSDLPEVKIPPRKAKKADAEIEKIAAELAKAKTIEDVDDKLAETLFGEELNLIAAQVVANSTGAESANDEELALFDTSTAQIAQASGSTTPEPIAAARPEVEVSLATPETSGEGGLDLSASQRLKTVRALNADRDPESVGTGAPAPPTADNTPPPAPTPKPEPIEDQINTSMTQTLKALNVRPPISGDESAPRYDDDDEDEQKSGFFSRFRRS